MSSNTPDTLYTPDTKIRMASKGASTKGQGKKKSSKETVEVLVTTYDTPRCRTSMVITWIKVGDFITIGGQAIAFQSEAEVREYTTKVVKENTTVREFDIVITHEEQGSVTTVNGMSPPWMSK